MTKFELAEKVYEKVGFSRADVIEIVEDRVSIVPLNLMFPPVLWEG